jgi:hypothetical protein
MKITKLTYSHGHGLAPTTVGYAIDEQGLVLFGLNSNSGPCVSNHLIGITEKICEIENCEIAQFKTMLFQMGKYFTAPFWIANLPYGVKKIITNGVQAFKTELNEARTPAHLRVSKSVMDYQQLSDQGTFELGTQFDIAASDGHSYALTAIPYAHADYGHGGYIFARPEFMGSSMDHKYETIIVPTVALTQYIESHDPDMIAHAERKFEGRSLDIILERNDFMRPLMAGSWGMDVSDSSLCFSTGDASVLKIFSNARIPFFPVSVQASVYGEITEKFKADIRALSVGQVGPASHLRIV